MDGADPDGEPLRLHFYVFKGKQQLSYRLTIIDHVMDDEFDPPMQAFLESVREQKK